MRRWSAVVVLVGVVVAGCGGDNGDIRGAGGADDGFAPIRVVASFYPIAEAAARVGGDRVDVTNVTPAGSEPHDLELTTAQVDQLEDADLVVYLGKGFQPAVEAVAERRDGPVVDLLAELPVGEGAIEALELEEGHGGEGEEEGHAEEGGEGHGEMVDPHYWLNPMLQSRAAGVIASELSKLAEGDAATFAANLERYQAALATLDREFETGLSGCARDQMVTSHAAFFYLADRYELTQLPIAGLSPEAEPDAQRIAELTTLITDRGITTVFYETLASPAVAETLAREAGATAAVLDPIEGLSEQALAAGQDYAGVMRKNLAALRSALGCP